MTHLALGLAGPHLIELAGNPALLARWEALPLAYTVLGIDRIDGSGPSPVTLDSSAIGASLAARTRQARFLIVASPQRDQPYNLARRVASLGHLSRGRSGVLFGAADAYAVPEPGGLPLTAATAIDAARVVRALEQSWPYDSVIGDRETGILVQSDRIVHIDHDGVYSVAGPLNVPEPPTGASLIAWYPTGPDDVVADSAPIDLIVGPGTLLRPVAGQSLAEILTDIESRAFTPVPPGPLRAALGLSAPARAVGGRPAFAVPAPNPSL
ncbi:LLM class oxidoreductase [Paractinoplanes durhamensis]|uniref:LLM class flavin-dependent oxidoreductase n=1 Tax=Paractinoplanes durhamensis TaxID=113563 RepID=A0ABQ3YRU6_9ACTN|nr:LLM class flavin-dependent oxidoreductase [Actinoplanes durhamensis]GIE00320.1 hypothetical protein Adu01nite_16700 [Actinoplanes durhamensis]